MVVPLAQPFEGEDDRRLRVGQDVAVLVQLLDGIEADPDGADARRRQEHHRIFRPRRGQHGDPVASGDAAGEKGLGAFLDPAIELAVIPAHLLENDGRRVGRAGGVQGGEITEAHGQI